LRGIELACLALLGLCVAGCASAPSGQGGDPGDPHEAANRRIFAFDQMLDRNFLLPTAKNYNRFVPQFGRDRIHDLLENLDLPVTFANDVLQGETKRAGQTFARFTVNTTLGLGGLFDPATTRFKLPDHAEDFGQTLGVWGVGDDPYVMLPGLGPSSTRDVAGRIGDIALDPMTWITFKQHIWWWAGRQYFKVLDARARNIDTLEGIERSSVDFYAATRSLYRQYRSNEIRNGQPEKQELPDL
jgi:phospholipid-binding lipoprotein MlaA